jgi:hypothetical protein
MPLLLFNDPEAIDRKMKLEQELPQRMRTASPNKQIIMRDAAEICKSGRKQKAEKNATAAVDLQDNQALIWHHNEPAPELK